MAENFEYIVPIVYAPKDNETFIQKTLVTIKDCSAFGNPNGDCAGWNFNHCPNDNNYCQPFIRTDKLYLQFLFDQNTYYYFTKHFIDIDTGDEFDASAALTVNSGQDKVLTPFANLTIDLANPAFDGVGCWYLKLKVYKCKLIGTAPFNACVAVKVAGGMTTAQARDACYDELCEEFDYFTTEPYCLIPCDDKTVLIEGIYKNYDCDGNYYGLFQQKLVPNNHRCLFRIRAEVFADGYAFTTTLNGEKTVKSKQRTKYVFATPKIPPYVADQIAKCFNSSKLLIDGVEYKPSNKLDKNFEEGQMWILRENIFQDCEEINFTCE